MDNYHRSFKLEKAGHSSPNASFFQHPPPKKCLKDPKSKTIPVQITIPVQEILKFSELTLVNPLFCIEFWGFPDVSSP